MIGVTSAGEAPASESHGQTHGMCPAPQEPRRPRLARVQEHRPGGLRQQAASPGCGADGGALGGCVVNGVFLVVI